MASAVVRLDSKMEVKKMLSMYNQIDCTLSKVKRSTKHTRIHHRKLGNIMMVQLA